MPKARVPKSSMLDETNMNSYIPDGRNAQADYYRLENREKQLKAIQNLDAAQIQYILGGNLEDGIAANAKEAKRKEVEAAVTRIHEKDLIELKALVYLQGLPDTSPELIQLKAWCGCDTREQIARYIADKQIKKLMMSQVEAIINVPDLTKVYKKTIKSGATKFAELF